MSSFHQQCIFCRNGAPHLAGCPTLIELSGPPREGEDPIAWRNARAVKSFENGRQQAFLDGSGQSGTVWEYRSQEELLRYNALIMLVYSEGVLLNKFSSTFCD